MPKKEIAIKHATVLAMYLLVVWGFYRYLIRMPEELEDIVIKPLFWLIPLFVLLKREKLGLSSIGLTFKNLFPSIYMSLILGVFFAVIGGLVNYAKYGSLNFTDNIGDTTFFTALMLSLMTGFTEEIVFRGYIFNRMWHGLGDEWKANLLVSIVWGMVHIPIALFWWKLNTPLSVGVFILMVLFGIGSSYVFARTRNIASSVLLHMLWQWPIILFR
jgi:uncharacterized protein